jgi:hypothetical protein
MGLIVKSNICKEGHYGTIMSGICTKLLLCPN